MNSLRTQTLSLHHVDKSFVHSITVYYHYNTKRYSLYPTNQQFIHILVALLFSLLLRYYSDLDALERQLI